MTLYYNYLWVQRRHNCSPAASFTNCIMTLHLLKSASGNFFSIPITQKCQILSCDILVANKRYNAVACVSMTTARQKGIAHVTTYGPLGKLMWHYVTGMFSTASVWHSSTPKFFINFNSVFCVVKCVTNNFPFCYHSSAVLKMSAVGQFGGTTLRVNISRNEMRYRSVS